MQTSGISFHVMTISSSAGNSCQKILISSSLYGPETWNAACPYPLYHAVSLTYFCHLTLIVVVADVLLILIFFVSLLHLHALQIHLSCAQVQQALSKIHTSSLQGELHKQTQKRLEGLEGVKNLRIHFGKQFPLVPTHYSTVSMFEMNWN
jgi:hypothetical protein